MSGGNFDYLCHREVDELFKCERLEPMITELIDMGYKDAAKETMALKLLVDQTKVRMEVYLIDCARYGKAVEWYCSGDSGWKRWKKLLEVPGQ